MQPRDACGDEYHCPSTPRGPVDLWIALSRHTTDGVPIVKFCGTWRVAANSLPTWSIPELVQQQSRQVLGRLSLLSVVRSWTCYLGLSGGEATTNGFRCFRRVRATHGDPTELTNTQANDKNKLDPWKAGLGRLFGISGRGRFSGPPRVLIFLHTSCRGTAISWTLHPGCDYISFACRRIRACG